MDSSVATPDNLLQQVFGYRDFHKLLRFFQLAFLNLEVFGEDNSALDAFRC